MKKIAILAVICFKMTLIEAQVSPAADILAQHISRKMKDTLSLTESQRIQIYKINIQLHIDKMAMRKLYAGSDSLTKKIQTIEDGRNTLYLPILGAEKYSLYLQKKRFLVTSD